MAKVKSESVVYGCDACAVPHTDESAELQKVGSFTSKPKHINQIPENYQPKTFDVYQCPSCHVVHIMMNGQFIDEYFQENIIQQPMMINSYNNYNRYPNPGMNPNMPHWMQNQQNQMNNPYGNNNYNPYWHNPYMQK